MVNGICRPGFARVKEEFARNFAERGEVGASVCVTLDGATVVDLWGGVADRRTKREWASDTVCVVWSCTKGPAALCANILIDSGELELSAPVAKYWPKFAAAGKGGVTVEHVLAHRAGVPALTRPLPPNAFYDWELMVDALAAQEPFYAAGTKHGYHGLTFGWLVGELVRRASGVSIGEFLSKQVTTPLGAEFWLGAPKELEGRIAPVALYAPGPNDTFSEYLTMAGDPKSVPGMIFGNTGGYISEDKDGFDGPAAHAAQIPAAGGIANGRGLATIYAPLANGGTIAGKRLISEQQISRMSTTVSAGFDDTLRIDSRFGLGFMQSMDNRRKPAANNETVILGPSAFGHVGFGGSLGFADPNRRLSFGYVMNQMGPGALMNGRGQALVDAVYGSVGATSDASGSWR
jgi:CubicO group peptidase (beta-lactamase class C family)